jgi:hypothetical protein
MKKISFAILSGFILFALSYAQGFEDIGSFKTPSSNIYCVAYKVKNTASLDCQMQEITAKIPAQPKDCDLDFGYRFGMDERGKAARGCYGDTIANPNYKTLAYGKIWKVTGFTCDVTTIRLRCVNLEKHGFELSKAVQRFF